MPHNSRTTKLPETHNLCVQRADHHHQQQQHQQRALSCVLLTTTNVLTVPHEHHIYMRVRKKNHSIPYVGHAFWLCSAQRICVYARTSIRTVKYTKTKMRRNEKQRERERTPCLRAENIDFCHSLLLTHLCAWMCGSCWKGVFANRLRMRFKLGE